MGENCNLPSETSDWNDSSKFRTLADSIDQGFCVVEIIVDEHGEAIDYRFVEINRVFENQTGLHDAIGKRMLEMAPDHERFWVETYGRVAETGISTRFEHAAEALGRWYDVFAFRVGDPRSRQVALLFQDISERVRDRAALRAAERRKDEFMVILAHELRNPLSPMRSAVQLARAVQSWDQLAKPLDIMERQIQHMATLISDLVDVSSIALGTIEPELSDCDLCEVIRRAGEIAQPAMEARSQHFEESLPAAAVPWQANVRRLAQAISNLMLNASKYTPDGGRVSVALFLEGNAAVVEVVDNGIGIPADRLADIFELFSRVDSARSHAQGGLGVGLAVAKSVAQLHGGSIEARSGGPGCGSTFRLRLPSRFEHAEEDSGHLRKEPR